MKDVAGRARRHRGGMCRIPRLIELARQTTRIGMGTANGINHDEETDDARNAAISTPSRKAREKAKLHFPAAMRDLGARFVHD